MSKSYIINMSSSEDEGSVFRKEVYREMGEDRDKDAFILFDEIYNMLKIEKGSLIERKMKNLKLKIQELEILLEEYRPE